MLSGCQHLVNRDGGPGSDYHPHLNLDDGPVVMAYTRTYRIPDVKPGKHKLRVVITDRNHQPLPGEGWEKLMDVEVHTQ